MASADSTQQRRKARPQPALLEGGFVDAPLGVQLHLRTDQSNRADALDGDGRGRTLAKGMAGAGDCIAHVAIAAPRDAKADVKAAWQYEASASLLRPHCLPHALLCTAWKIGQGPGPVCMQRSVQSGEVAQLRACKQAFCLRVAVQLRARLLREQPGATPVVDLWEPARS